jgi:hypothetical protein
MQTDALVGDRNRSCATLLRVKYRARSLSQWREVPPYGLLVPLEADARSLGNDGVAIFYPNGVLEDGSRRVQVFQAVGGRARAQKVGAHLGEDVAAERKSRRLCQGSPFARAKASQAAMSMPRRSR